MENEENIPNKKNKKRISVAVFVIVIIFTVVITCTLSVILTIAATNAVYDDLPSKENMYGILSEADSVIRENYIGDTSELNAGRGAVDGYLRSLDKGKNLCMTADEYDAYTSRNSGTDDKTGETIETARSETFGTAGYIELTEIYDCTPDQFKKQLDSLLSKQITGLVIDLRDVESSNIEAAVKIIDRIVPVASEGTKTIATVEMKNGKKETFAADQESIHIPCAVLVNSKTSGAAELIACDIRDFSKGSVVGLTTAGDGTYRKEFTLSDGSAMFLTVGIVMPYISDTYDEVGVKPDARVKSADEKKAKEIKDDEVFLQGFAELTR